LSPRNAGAWFVTGEATTWPDKHNKDDKAASLVSAEALTSARINFADRLLAAPHSR
jgi:hypothetical protein